MSFGRMNACIVLALFAISSAVFPLEKENKRYHQHKQNSSAAAPAKTDAFNDNLQSVGEIVRQWKNGDRSLARPVQQSNLSKKQAFGLQSISDPHTDIRWSKSDGVPIYLQAENLLPNLSSSASIDDVVREFSKKHNSRFGLFSQDDRLEVVKVMRDDLGMQHIRLQQVYANIPVYGRDIYLHQDKSGRLISANGRLLPTTSDLNLKPALLAKQAEEVALASINEKNRDSIESTSLTIYPTPDGQKHLAFIVTLRPAVDKNLEVFVDAHSGEILFSANRVCYDGPVNASGTDLSGVTRNFNAYQIGSEIYMIDTSKPMFNAGASTLPDEAQGAIYVFDAQNSEGDKLFYNTTTNPNAWQNANAVSAAFYGGIVYDYYRNVHNRNAIDGNGGSMYMIVNIKENFNNAFWNGKAMFFGNGDGNSFSDLAGSLDVTGHEMTHGVVENTANLIYENQSGALNESFADVFGAAVEFYHKGANANWLMGEEVTTPNVAGDALRDLEQPDGPRVAFSKQPAHMSQFQSLPNTEDGDNGGVHVNSGIPNRAFYLVVQTIGMQKAEKIYYRALANYLTRSSQFIDARLALSKAAADLYGQGSGEQTAVHNAYDQVGITDGQGTPPPPIEEPVVGQDWVLATDASSNVLYRVSADGYTIEPIASMPLLGKPSVSDDGSFALFVDQNYNPWIVNTDGSGEQQLDNSSSYWNLAISPNGNKIAAVSKFADGLVYILDLNDSNRNQVFELYSQTYSQGEQPGFVAYADALDWTLDNQFVVYDALNINVKATGDTLEYWDINAIRIADGNITRIFPPQPEGVNIGNPVLASNNDFTMALDYIDEFGNVSIYAANLETGDIGLVADNGQALGRPDFSPNDDAMIYQYTNGQDYAVYWRQLASDGINGTGDEFQFLTGASNPVWMTIGIRTDVTDDIQAAIPKSLTLAQNYPNPFNPTTTISFDLPESDHIELDVFNMLGQKVRTLANDTYEAGSHKFTFDARELPSGIYMYKLSANGQTLVRKMVLMK
jgi:Zn-dependent metalloprotease